MSTRYISYAEAKQVLKHYFPDSKHTINEILASPNHIRDKFIRMLVPAIENDENFSSLSSKQQKEWLLYNFNKVRDWSSKYEKEPDDQGTTFNTKMNPINTSTPEEDDKWNDSFEKYGEKDKIREDWVEAGGKSELHVKRRGGAVYRRMDGGENKQQEEDYKWMGQATAPQQPQEYKEDPERKTDAPPMNVQLVPYGFNPFSVFNGSGSGSNALGSGSTNRRSLGGFNLPQRGPPQQFIKPVPRNPEVMQEIKKYENGGIIDEGLDYADMIAYNLYTGSNYTDLEKFRDMRRPGRVIKREQEEMDRNLSNMKLSEPERLRIHYGKEYDDNIRRGSFPPSYVPTREEFIEQQMSYIRKNGGMVVKRRMMGGAQVDPEIETLYETYRDYFRDHRNWNRFEADYANHILNNPNFKPDDVREMAMEYFYDWIEEKGDEKEEAAQPAAAEQQQETTQQQHGTENTTDIDEEYDKGYWAPNARNGWKVKKCMDGGAPEDIQDINQFIIPAANVDLMFDQMVTRFQNHPNFQLFLNDVEDDMDRNRLTDARIQRHAEARFPEFFRVAKNMNGGIAKKAQGGSIREHERDYNQRFNNNNNPIVQPAHAPVPPYHTRYLMYLNQFNGNPGMGEFRAAYSRLLRNPNVQMDVWVVDDIARLYLD